MFIVFRFILDYLFYSLSLFCVVLIFINCVLLVKVILVVSNRKFLEIVWLKKGNLWEGYWCDFLLLNNVFIVKILKRS